MCLISIAWSVWLRRYALVFISGNFLLIIRGTVPTLELHAPWRTQEHGCAVGGVSSNADTENMQVSPSSEGTYKNFLWDFILPI